MSWREIQRIAIRTASSWGLSVEYSQRHVRANCPAVEVGYGELAIGLPE